jgi:small ubiquitin-related modifier
MDTKTLSFFRSLLILQSGEETFFKVKMSTWMEKVFQTYTQRKGVELNSIRFLLDGTRVQNDATSTELGLEDQDQIDCMLYQTGGTLPK